MSEQTVFDESARDDDLATLLARREHARPNRVTWVLVTLLLLGAGFVGGAFAYKTWGPSASIGMPSFAGGLPAMAGAGSTSSGTGPSTTGTGTGFPGAPADLTIGTVKLVDRTNLYVTTTSGETVKVLVPDSASVTAEQEIALADLAAGSTVIIRGATADDGTVTATSVSEGSIPTTQGVN